MLNYFTEYQNSWAFLYHLLIHPFFSHWNLLESQFFLSSFAFPPSVLKNQMRQYLAFSDWHPSVDNMTRRVRMSFHDLINHIFLAWNNIPLQECICLFTHSPLNDILVASTLDLLRTRLAYIFEVDFHGNKINTWLFLERGLNCKGLTFFFSFSVWGNFTSVSLLFVSLILALSSLETGGVFE